MIATGTAMLGAAALGAGAQMYGASKAAKAQTNAANQAMAFQQQMMAQQRNDLMPYMNAGRGALDSLNQNMDFYNSPIAMLDQQGLENLPGYQFTRDQGLKAVQANAAARGLGSSGTAIKGAERFASGLADSTYGQQFDRYFNLEQANRQQPFNRLMSMAQLGGNAAAGAGQGAMQTGQMVGNSLIGAGNAQGASAMAQGNAIAGGANSLSSYMMLQQMMQNQSQQRGMYGAQTQGYYGSAPATAPTGYGDFTY